LKYVGNKSKVEWVGTVQVTQGQLCLVVESEDGEPMLAIGLGKVVPDNWLHERVRVTVEKLGGN
jgi:hypothetical protein